MAEREKSKKKKVGMNFSLKFIWAEKSQEVWMGFCVNKEEKRKSRWFRSSTPSETTYWAFSVFYCVLGSKSPSSCLAKKQAEKVHMLPPPSIEKETNVKRAKWFHTFFQPYSHSHLHSFGFYNSTYILSLSLLASHSSSVISIIDLHTM